MSAGDQYQSLRKSIPENVTIVLAAKTRTPDEIMEVISAGALDIGYNYVQEADTMYQALGSQSEKMTWHMIGHLQTNKINRALDIFNYFQTIDSQDRAKALNNRLLAKGLKTVPVLMEINIAGEKAKDGFPPDFTVIEDAVRGIINLPGLDLRGFMTMGPADADGPSLRPWFRKARKIFDEINSLDIPSFRMTTLSMGMSDSYIEAIEEGSTMIRLGSLVFGDRR